MGRHAICGVVLTRTLVCGRETGVEFLSCLMFNKGKKLISRLLPFLDHAAGLRILTVVTSHIPTLMSRDTDEVDKSSHRCVLQTT